MSELVVLGLGSNSILKREDKEFSPVEILKFACLELEKILEPKTAKFSSIYKTKAMYYENQQDFYNMVVCGYYQNSPEELLKQVNYTDEEILNVLEDRGFYIADKENFLKQKKEETH